MRELQLNDVGMPALLVQARRRHGAKAVPGHGLVVIPHASKRHVDRVLADWPLGAEQRGKHERALTGQPVEVLQPRSHLPGIAADVSGAKRLENAEFSGS